MGRKTFRDRTLWTLTDNTLESIKSEGEMPTVFVTGDAHRDPPFQWLEDCQSELVKQYFKKLVDQRRLCVYVEQHYDEITSNSVPSLLRPLIAQQRIFGWELEVFRYFREVMGIYLFGHQGLMGLKHHWENKSNHRDLIKCLEALHENIREADKRLKDIAYPAMLRGRAEVHEEYLKYYKYLYEASLPKSFGQKWTTGWAAQPQLPKKKYSQFLTEYYQAADELRTSVDVHMVIGARIQNTMRIYPECTHLIACGNDHLRCQFPLSTFIFARGGGSVVDVDDGRLGVARSGKPRTAGTGVGRSATITHSG